MYNINGIPLYRYDVNGLDLLGSIAMAADANFLAVIIFVVVLIAALVVAALLGYGFWKLINRKKPTQ